MQNSTTANAALEPTPVYAFILTGASSWYPVPGDSKQPLRVELADDTAPLD